LIKVSNQASNIGVPLHSEDCTTTLIQDKLRYSETTHFNISKSTEKETKYGRTRLKII